MGIKVWGFGHSGADPVQTPQPQLMERPLPGPRPHLPVPTGAPRGPRTPHLLYATFTVSSRPLKVRNKASSFFGVFSARFWLEATPTSRQNPAIWREKPEPCPQWQTLRGPRAGRRWSPKGQHVFVAKQQSPSFRGVPSAHQTEFCGARTPGAATVGAPERGGSSQQPLAPTGGTASLGAGVGGLLPSEMHPSPELLSEPGNCSLCEREAHTSPAPVLSELF